jgi:quinol monooxygenase YgiN
MVTKGLYVLLEAKPGLEDEVVEFLRGALPVVEQEAETIAWLAVRFGPTTFAIVDAAADAAGVDAHLAGRFAASLMARAEALFAQAPMIERLDVLAAKLPG